MVRLAWAYSESWTTDFIYYLHHAPTLNRLYLLTNNNLQIYLALKMRAFILHTARAQEHVSMFIFFNNRKALAICPATSTGYSNIKALFGLFQTESGGSHSHAGVVLCILWAVAWAVTDEETWCILGLHCRTRSWSSEVWAVLAAGPLQHMVWVLTSCGNKSSAHLSDHSNNKHWLLSLQSHVGAHQALFIVTCRINNSTTRGQERVKVVNLVRTSKQCLQLHSSYFGNKI